MVWNYKWFSGLAVAVMLAATSVTCPDQTEVTAEIIIAMQTLLAVNGNQILYNLKPTNNYVDFNWIFKGALSMIP